MISLPLKRSLFIYLCHMTLVSVMTETCVGKGCSCVYRFKKHSVSFEKNVQVYVLNFGLNLI